jgi:transcriptional regulator with XRE-family HTH domain
MGAVQTGREGVVMSNGEELLSIRETMGLTQKEMAAQLGVTAEYVCRVEKGKSKPSLTLMRLARLLCAFGITADGVDNLLADWAELGHGVREILEIARTFIDKS